MKMIFKIIKSYKKTLIILTIIISLLLLVKIYDTFYIYPHIFFYDTNSLMIMVFKNRENIDKTDSRGITPLMKAVSVRNKTAVKMLLERGANPNKIEEKELFCDTELLSSYVVLMSDEEIRLCGINDGNFNVKNKTLRWISKNTDIKFPIPMVESEYPAKLALLINDYEILEILLQKGAIPPKLSDINSYEKGTTEKIKKLLIKYGAEPK